MTEDDFVTSKALSSIQFANQTISRGIRLSITGHTLDECFIKFKDVMAITEGEYNEELNDIKIKNTLTG